MDKRKTNINIKDIASIAKVSVTTVSHAISGKRYVREETKQHILKIIEDYNYEPNIIARSLSKKESGIVGIITPVLNNEFYSEIIEGIEETLRQRGYMLVINISNHDNEKEKETFRKIDSLFIDGLILVGGYSDISYISEINKRNIPVLLALRENFQNQYIRVGIDFEKAIFDITDYLFESGHKDIGYVGCLREGILSDHKKLEGYLKSLEKNIKMKNRDIIIVPKKTANKESHDFFNLMDAYLKEENYNKRLKITALVCQNDKIAIDVIKALNQNGYRVPEDVSVTGFGDTTPGKYHEPSLTTIMIPKKEIGRLSAEAFLKEFDDEKTSNSDLLLDTKIIQRNSSKQLKF